MKKKILFIGRFPPPVHGAAVMNELYFNGKKINEAFEVKKIKVNNSSSLSSEILNSKKEKLNPRKFFWTFKSLVELSLKLIFFNPDLVYFEIAPKGMAFVRDSLFAILCKIFRKKILFQIHSRKIDESRYAKSIFKNTKMILLSNKLYEGVSKIFEKKDVLFLNNGIKDVLSKKEFDTLLKENRKEKNFLFLSNLYESKGPLEVLNICNELKGKLKFKCSFVGEFPNEDIKEKWLSLRKKYNLEKECQLLGPKYGEDKYKILKETDFLIFPTSDDCFPLVILESFMFGIPVMTYDVGAIKDMVSEDFLGSVKKVGNWKGLARDIKIRLKKKADRELIRNYFLKNYTFETAEKNLIKIFEEELKNGKR